MSKTPAAGSPSAETPAPHAAFAGQPAAGAAGPTRIEAADDVGPSSRLPGFYELTRTERLAVVQSFAGLTAAESTALGQLGGLGGEMLEVFIENAVGSFSLPLGIATNFLVNGRNMLVPMAVEETSVVAAASHGAKLARAGGGFTATSTPPVMTGQIQLLIKDASRDYAAILTERKDQLIAYANRGQDRLVARGGGAIDLTWHLIPEIRSLVLHLHINTCDAMGANIVNTMCERVSGLMPELLGCDIGLRILTNLTDRRRTTVRCLVPAKALTTPDFAGEDVVARIVMAYEFAAHDIHRATTNNKGIMNGIDPVLIATGNDWRAIEAGAHAFACRSGKYQPMAVWSSDAAGNLLGELELPMAVGTIGGVTSLHPGAAAALRLLAVGDANELAGIITAVGLAQNLSALRALASEGIQRGHMSLHKSNIDLLQRQGASKA